MTAATGIFRLDKSFANTVNCYTSVDLPLIIFLINAFILNVSKGSDHELCFFPIANIPGSAWVGGRGERIFFNSDLGNGPSSAS